MKNQFISYFLFLSLGVSFFTSCSLDIGCKKGKGNIIIQERQVESFTALETRGNFTINIFQDSSITEQFITISAYENIIDLIQTRISGQSLVIDSDECSSTTEQVIITVRTPALSQIVLSGSGDVLLNDTPRVGSLELVLKGSGTIRTIPTSSIISSTNCNAKLQGSGNIELAFKETNIVNAVIEGSGKIILRGEAKENNLSIEGSGDIRAFSLPVLKSVANITGSGKIELYATDTDLPSKATVKARISGSGKVFVKGNAVIESNISGSGKIERID